MARRLILKGGCVLSLDRAVGNHASTDVLVEDGIIREVGPGLRARDAETIDATDTIVMPGFVDTHRHAWKSLFRNIGGSVAAADPGVYGNHYTAEDVYTATLVGLLGAVEAGVTTVTDWSDIQIDDSFTEAALQAHTDSGLRTIFVSAPAPWAPRRDDRLEVATARAGANTTVAYGSPDPAGSDLGSLSAGWAAARGAGLRIHTHVGGTSAEKGIVSALAGQSLLGSDVTLVHCTNLDDADLTAITSSGARISMTPSREMTSGQGAPPLQGLIDRGIRPGLGVDDELEGPGDMFAQMRAANSIQHATLFDLKLAGKAGVPNLLTTRDVIRYGTIDGARAVGLEEVTGSITPGKRADIIVLRADRPNIAPVNDPIGAVVWGMDTSNVDWVFVNGETLVREGALIADVASIRERAFSSQTRVGAAAGLLAGAGGVA